MHIPPFHAWFCHACGIVVAGLHDRVDLQLALVEMTADRCCTCVVRAIVVYGFRSTVAEHQFASHQGCLRGRSVLNLAVLRENCGEANHGSIRVGDAGERSSNFFLCYTWAAHLHGRCVHLVAKNGCALQFLNLLIGLNVTHLHHSLDQLHAGAFLLLVGVDAQEVEYLDLDVGTIRGQEVDLTLLAQSLIADGLQRFHGSRVGHTHLLSHVVYAIY